MIIDITYHCSMGCTHCMSDCKPDHQHMTLETFADCLEFCKKNRLKGLFLSGGEVFEHPRILEILTMIENFVKEYPDALPITIATNGRILSSNMEIYNRVMEFREKIGPKTVFIQVTDDPRFYPNKLTEKQKYRLRKMGVILDIVPSAPGYSNKCLYPQGRALNNFDDSWWNTKAPKCANVRLLSMQLPPTAMLHDLVHIMTMSGKLCTPTISPKGEIKMGESALCPPAASIYDSGEEIMKKIRSFKCSACQIPLERLKETNPLIAKTLF